MDFLKGGVVAVFIAFYLLPGLLGTVVYDYLVEGEKRDNFERVLHAFVLTLVSTLMVHGVFGLPLLPAGDVGNDTPVTRVLEAVLDKNLLYVSCSSVFIAVAVAALNNHGVIYRLLKALKLTHKVSSVDVWQDTFNRHARQWIRVTFSDGRVLVGWPKHYSATGKPRELFVANATWWVTDENGEVGTIDITGPGVYIADFSRVTMVELLDGQEKTNG